MMKDERRLLLERLANLNKATPKKAKSKDSDKETAKQIEKVVKKHANNSNAILVEDMDRRFSDLERKCTDMIGRSMAELKHDMIMMDTVTTGRISQLEAKVLAIERRLDESSHDSGHRQESWSSALSKVESSLRELVETERSKRIAMIKKAQDQTKQQFISTEALVQGMKDESSCLLKDLRDDLRVQSKEVVGLKEKTSALCNDEDYGGDTPARSGRFFPGKDRGLHAVQRLRKMEEHLVELQDRLQETEDDVQHLKDNIISRPSASNPTSPVRGRHGLNALQLDQSFTNAAMGGAQSHEVRDLERKLRKLAENTTKACKSLSSGLTDVQETALTLYRWTDKVHDAFEVVADKVNLPSNLCPRAKVPGRGRDEDAEYGGRKRSMG